MKVLGMSGSLRQGSFNTMALRAARDLAPDGIDIEIADIRGIPLYDEDLRSAGEPGAVTELKARIRAADAVLLVTPEYNFSIPGVFKNALDWLSRPPEQPFDGKAVAIMGASPGPVGTARVQYDLRKVLLFMNAFVVAKPEVFIGLAPTKFDAEGQLIDETARKLIVDLLSALQKLRERIG